MSSSSSSSNIASSSSQIHTGSCTIGLDCPDHHRPTSCKASASSSPPTPSTGSLVRLATLSLRPSTLPYRKRKQKGGKTKHVGKKRQKIKTPTLRPSWGSQPHRTTRPSSRPIRCTTVSPSPTRTPKDSIISFRLLGSGWTRTTCSGYARPS